MRKLATAAAVSLALASGGAFGLGLGDIEMRSALNQPMQAEISLTAVKPGELEGMIVKLASADAFARAGIERSSVLTDLSFTLDRSGSEPVIRVSSSRPVVEPFLNFLLEVDWPQGRMIREYTVLLDPPVFMSSSASDRNAATDQAAVVQRGDQALVVPTPIERGSAQAGGLIENDLLSSPPDGEVVDLQAITNGQQFDEQGFQVDNYDTSEGELVSLTDLSAPNPRAIEQRSQGATESFEGFEVEVLGGTEEVSDGNTGFANEGDGSSIVSLNDLDSAATAASDGDTIFVRRGDTLYEIARSNSVVGASVQQMMIALLKANESSFINNNINLVKAGSSLRVPGSSEATRLSQAEAIAAVSEQNQLWRDYRDQLRSGSGAQLASTGSSTPAPGSLGGSTRSQPEEDPSIQESTSIGEQAQAALDNAQNEIGQREELKLVADSDSTSASSAASATAGVDSETDRIAEVNRKLQLAREELSSTRLQSSDLADQASELLNTTENLDSLVALRQTGVANLEAQLADARRNGENTVNDAGSFVDEAGDSSMDLLADTSASAGDVVDSGTDAANDAGSFVDEAGDSSMDLLADTSATAGDVVDSGTNALTEAGEELGQVELYSEIDDQQGLQSADGALDGQTEDTTSPLQISTPPAQPTTWYQSLLAQPLKLLMVAGALLGTLGLAALLLWRRRRADNIDEQTVFGDDVDFIDEDEAEELQADLNQNRFEGVDEFDDFGEVGTASVASSGFDEYDSVESDDLGDASRGFHEASVDDSQDRELSPVLPVMASTSVNENLDQDDTMSEADVYLNYGLHGQAEELLNKAVENHPDNPDYACKLLETYHGQHNAEKYLVAAKDFHARFGGDTNPDWNRIATDGAELIPDEPLFQTSAVQAETTISDFSHQSAKLTNEDFLSSDESGVGSINRSIDATYDDDFAVNFDSNSDSSDSFDVKTPVLAASAAVAAGVSAFASTDDSNEFAADETGLMDQSIDPAFAFDETDLEATGDFSHIADELSAESGDSLDFPSFDDTTAIPSNSESYLDDSTITGSDSLDEALTMHEVDGSAGSSDDLTLDLDQLTGDLEIDSAELMNPDLSDINFENMSFNDELSSNDMEAGAVSNDSGAIETMLDLARAYIDMGDKDSASSALDEIVKSGNPAQVTEAESLLRNIS